MYIYYIEYLPYFIKLFAVKYEYCVNSYVCPKMYALLLCSIHVFVSCFLFMQELQRVKQQLDVLNSDRDRLVISQGVHKERSDALKEGEECDIQAVVPVVPSFSPPSDVGCSHVDAPSIGSPVYTCIQYTYKYYAVHTVYSLVPRSPLDIAWTYA